MKWLNPSGGLRYHYKALRFRHSLWQQHTENTAQWLKQWQPTSSHLVLMGASGGYALSSNFLNRFEKITAIDPDPLAPLLFQRRFSKSVSKPVVRWSKQNYLMNKDHFLWPEGLFYLREEHPDSAILFCNLLGQLPFLMQPDEKNQSAWLNNWAVFLQTGEWASFHDLWSTAAHLPTQPCWHNSPANEGIETSVRHFTKMKLAEPVYDHLTKDLFAQNCLRSQWLWQIEPHQIHCVEGVRPSKQETGK